VRIAAFAGHELAQWAEVGRSQHFRAQSLRVADNRFETRLQLPQSLDRPIETSSFAFHSRTCLRGVHSLCRCELSVSRTWLSTLLSSVLRVLPALPIGNLSVTH